MHKSPKVALLPGLGCNQDMLQGVSHWSVQSKSALVVRRTNNFIDLWCIAGSQGIKFWVSSTSFQESNIGWPQQPPTKRVLKFNIIFHDSTKIFCFSKHQSKAKFKNLDDTEVLSSDFQALEPMQPQWPLQPQQPQWPQWPRQPNFIKKLTQPDG